MCNCSLVHIVNQYHSVSVFNEGNKQNRVSELDAILSLTTDNAGVLMDKDHFVHRPLCPPRMAPRNFSLR